MRALWDHPAGPHRDKIGRNPMDTEREGSRRRGTAPGSRPIPAEGRVPLPGFSDPAPARQRHGHAATASARSGGCRTGRWPRSSPGPGQPPWRWPTTPSPAQRHRQAPRHGRRRRGGDERGNRPAGDALGGDDERVRRGHHDHHQDRQRQGHRHACAAPQLPGQLMMTTPVTELARLRRGSGSAPVMPPSPWLNVPRLAPAPGLRCGHRKTSAAHRPQPTLS